MKANAGPSRISGLPTPCASTFTGVIIAIFNAKFIFFLLMNCGYHSRVLTAVSSVCFKREADRNAERVCATVEMAFVSAEPLVVIIFRR